MDRRGVRARLVATTRLSALRRNASLPTTSIGSTNESPMKSSLHDAIAASLTANPPKKELHADSVNTVRAAARQGGRPDRSDRIEPRRRCGA